MKHHLLHLKKIGMLLAFLIFGVVTGQAVNITYSLKTHVDGRTITGTANLNAGADLLNSMPQALWRAYCTYSFYSDEAKTQEITTAPAESTTVYVDYVFDPPFVMSKEGEEATWNYLRSYNAGGSSRYYVFFNQAAENEYGGQIIKAVSNVPNIGNSGTTVAKQGHREWAFYGDAYDFKIQMNDPSRTKNWLVWSSTSRNEAPLTLGTKPALGWQLYINKATNNKFPNGGMVAMGVPNTTKYLASLQNVTYYVETENANSDFTFDSHNQLGNSYSAGSLWWYAFFATPVSESSTSTDIWHVTYKILKADGKTWYPDYVIQKKSSDLTPSWPPTGFTPLEGYDYDRFYLDENFSEKCPDDYIMPNGKNTVLYIKETDNQYVSEPWKTLVIPFTIDNVDEYFGEGAVQVNEYTKVDGHLRSAGGEEFFTCHLTFENTKTIEAYKPYLFKAVEVKKSLLDGMYAATGDEECQAVTFADATNAPGINVSMKGVLDADGAEIDNSDALKFYFASKADESAEDGYRYGFVRSKASFTIPKNRCYFYVEDGRTPPSGAPLTLSFDGNGFTGIGQMTIEASTAPTRIYNVNGQLMRVGTAGELPKGIYIANGKKFIVK